MLVELTIRNFAIIDQLTLRWSAGLNVLTGETGAGKSIIIDAVGALLGDRLGPEIVGEREERAAVEGIFEIDLQAERSRGLVELLQSRDLLEESGDVILRRDISRAGRSVCRVNGHAVTVGFIQQLGEHLVDIHGQSQHLSLLRVREHLDLLDRFGGLTAQRLEVTRLVDEWRRLAAERRSLAEELRAAARERDLLSHEVSEIEAVGPEPDEDQELARKHQRLRGAAHLRQSVEQTLGVLQGLDERPGAAELLGEAALLCRDGARVDETLSGPSELLARLSGDVEEIARELRSYLDGLEADPGQLEELEARRLMLADLKRKYGETLEEVLAYLERARTRLTRANQGESLLADLNRRESELRLALSERAQKLSTARSAAGRKMVAEIERELADLNLAGARLELAIEQQLDQAGLDWPTEDGLTTRVAVDSSGADRVELLFSANPGESLRGLGRIASGGELARVSLAVKAVLARVEPRGTLIFDEVDIGVGGRSAPVVGQKLWALSETHQVLCVTHMPQVAAYADRHLVVGKRTDGSHTSTGVLVVEGRATIDELAAMLGGTPGSAAAAANAEELLRDSRAWKSRRLAADHGRV